ncbi:helix-turn-helix domain-containing protein [Pseudomonas aeruginosa]|uniref:helix-turn-helix domain-containing protein n=1 Tax=Pseudomonas aeruginosa TaxID=287 RepID=UPI00106D04F0|nr:helix-turn-helix domain-containing protein [Pseudomonas aeruginosa]
MERAIDLSAWGERPPVFVQLLAAEVARSSQTKAGEAIGMSRSTVSTILANRYPSPSTSRVERRVLAALSRIECPALGEAVTSVECSEYLQRPAPLNNPVAMRCWKACRACPRNPHTAPMKREEQGHENRIALESLDA